MSMLGTKVAVCTSSPRVRKVDLTHCRSFCKAKRSLTAHWKFQASSAVLVWCWVNARLVPIMMPPSANWFAPLPPRLKSVTLPLASRGSCNG